MNNIITIPDEIKKIIVYDSPYIKTAYKGNIKVIFADYIASGRPSPIIENYILKYILPFYSNTHSNAYCGINMKNMVTKTKEFIRKEFKLNDTKKIIFTGSGTTSAINHLVYCLQLEDNKNINILLSPLEHHSNYLPWVENAKYNKNIKIVHIPVTKTFDINFEFIENYIKNTNQNTINIIPVTACSNVLGIKLNIKKLYNILQKYNNTNCCYGKKNLLFVDYACSAPYIKINAQYSDALMFSPHKFLGGQSTPGILIADKKLFLNKIPFNPGGGCVKKVCINKIEYDNDIEKRESAGTPNIIGIIKILKVLELKKMLSNIIENNESEITKYVFSKFNQLTKKYSNLILICPDIIDNRLPIVCVSIKNYHYNLIVAILSDMYGIQTRGGVSCTGLLAQLMKDIYNINGWCRISFNWIQAQDEIDYIINSFEDVLVNIESYSKRYNYDAKSNLYTFIEGQKKLNNKKNTS